MSTVTEPVAKSGPGRFSGAQHRLLAFSGLIVLMAGFSLASPNFLQTPNIINILQAASVNGVLAVAATIVIITGGIDVGAKYAIYALLDELANQGIGVVLISSELPEILGMTDRVAVFHAGRVVATLETRQTSQEEIMHHASGRGALSRHAS